MRFHITIKDNQTGETLRDFDTKAIIGGALNEEGSESIILANCNDYELARVITATEKGAEHVKSQKGPLFHLLVAAVSEGTRTED